MEEKMNTIAVSELRANLMKVLKEVARGSVVDVASRGKVVAKIVPPDHIREGARNRLKEVGKSAVLADVISPIDSKWKASDDNS
jgi:prevent-host-death family protein